MFWLQYCKFGNFHEGFIFVKLSICEVSRTIKSLRNGKITMSFTDIGKSSPSCEYLTLHAFRKNKILAKFSRFKALN